MEDGHLGLCNASDYCLHSGSGSQPEAETTGSNAAPPFKPTNLLYDEDYSYFRDPAKRTGAWWEPFKYIVKFRRKQTLYPIPAAFVQANQGVR